MYSCAGVINDGYAPVQELSMVDGDEVVNAWMCSCALVVNSVCAHVQE